MAGLPNISCMPKDHAENVALLRSRPLDSLLCLNPECPDHGLQVPGLLTVRYLRANGTIRYLRCTSCGAQFSERKGTPLFDLRLPEGTIFDVLRHHVEGVGVRSVARLCGVKHTTVIRIIKRFGDHFHAWHDRYVRGITVAELQMDEKWSFAFKKNKHCDIVDDSTGDVGDQWDHNAMAAESRLMVSLVPGKRTTEKTVELIGDFAARTGGVPPALTTTDEHHAYAEALAAQYPSPDGAKDESGRPKVDPRLLYATVRKTREKGRVVKVRRTIVFGTQAQLDAALAASTCSTTINTSFVERYNGTDRHFNKRKARATPAFSKDVEVHEAASWIGVTAYNFCRAHGGLNQKTPDGPPVKRTPAMAAGIVDRIISLVEIAFTPLLASLQAGLRGITA